VAVEVVHVAQTAEAEDECNDLPNIEGREEQEEEQSKAGEPAIVYGQPWSKYKEVILTWRHSGRRRYLRDE
jgi:hypothetical protein